MSAVATARDRRAPRPPSAAAPPLDSAWSTMSRVIEHRAIQYRATFRASIFSSFGNPILFLTAMGLGLGGYVGEVPNAAVSGLTYLQFLAPGLLAATVMQTGSFETAFPILAGFQWNKIFHAMYATPLRPRDLVLGNVVWVAIRLAMVSAIFCVVVVAYGANRSPLIILAIPAAVLTGLAFAIPMMAFSATQRRPEAFATLFRFGVTPLFLFSGTFYPIDTLPAIIQPIAWLSPLWHGAEICRAFMYGTAPQVLGPLLVHVAVLVTIAGIGLLVAFRTFERRLVGG
jgi:lipooligosaccharide transport system permease protein